MRIQKYLPQHTQYSRRQIEQMICENQIRVNGKRAEPGQQITIGDTIIIGQLHHKVSQLEARQEYVLMMNKPLGVICTRQDPGQRDNVYELLPKNDTQKWISVGRLDINTSGLILFTTSGELANQLMHPRYGLVRTYHVRVYGRPTEQDLKQLQSGITLDGKHQRFLSCLPLNRPYKQQESQNQWYEVRVSTGQYRLVRRMWQACNCRVSRLIRVAYGSVTLPRSLKEGQTRVLDDEEVKRLKQDVDQKH